MNNIEARARETVTVLIDREVSKVNVVSLQLEGYDGEENMLIKSERIENLIFSTSVEGKKRWAKPKLKNRVLTHFLNFNQLSTLKSAVLTNELNQFVELNNMLSKLQSSKKTAINNGFGTVIYVGSKLQSSKKLKVF